MIARDFRLQIRKSSLKYTGTDSCETSTWDVYSPMWACQQSSVFLVRPVIEEVGGEVTHGVHDMVLILQHSHPTDWNALVLNK